MMNVNKLIGYVGTRLIASRSRFQVRPGGRDQSRPYILIPASLVHVHNGARRCVILYHRRAIAFYKYHSKGLEIPEKSWLVTKIAQSAFTFLSSEEE